MDRSASRDRLNGASPRLHGLCADCIHADHCELRWMNPAPVYRCAEFVGREAPPPTRQACPERTTRPLNHYRGLCRSCLRADRCAYPKPPGGVWCCEEYE